MPVRLTPDAGEAIATKKVTPPEFDPDQEWVEILVFLRQDIRDNAVKLATSTRVQVKNTREEIDNDVYFFSLFKSQIKGWRLLDPELAEIPFCESNIRKLPWDLKSYLHDQIMQCGGVIPTQNVEVKTDSGQMLSYKSPDAVVVSGS